MRRKSRSLSFCNDFESVPWILSGLPPNSRISCWINHCLRKCITSKVHLEHGKRKKHLGNSLADLCTKGCFKRNLGYFWILWLSDWWEKCCVHALPRQARHSCQQRESGPAVSGHRAWDLWAGSGCALLLPSLRPSLPAPNPSGTSEGGPD